MKYHKDTSYSYCDAIASNIQTHNNIVLDVKGLIKGCTESQLLF